MATSLLSQANPNLTIPTNNGAGNSSTPTAATYAAPTPIQAAYGNPGTFTGYSSQPANIPIPVPKVPTTITSKNTTPTIPFALPTTQPDQTTNALGATADQYMTPPPNTTVNNGIATVNPPVDTGVSTTPVTPPTSLRDAILGKITGLNSTLGTQTDVNNQLNTQFGVDQKQQDYIDAYNAYNSKKLAYAQQTENTLNNSTGTVAGADQAAQVAQRHNNADLANLAVIAQGAQGNYQGALDIVKRKLDAQFSPIQAQIDNLGKFAELNNADLTDSQKTQLENQRFQLQNNLDQLKTAKTSAHQFALQQGINDPNVLNAIDAAQTPADVYSAIGGNPSDQSQSGLGAVTNSQYQSYVTQMPDGTQYVGQDKLANLTPFQKEDAGRQYAAAGITVLNPEQTTKVQNIDVTRQNLDGMTQTLLGTQNADGTTTGGLLGSGPVGRIGSAAKNVFGQVTQSNPQVAAFNGYRTLAVNTLQALGAGSGGARITASEIATAVSNLPTITDSKETAQAKLGIVNGFLTKWAHELLPQKSSSQTGNAPIIQSKVGAINPNF